jgi:SAM-dependent methyltransferase
MYNDIVSIYDEIFPLNKSFLRFIPAYLGNPGSRVLDLGCGPGDYVNELFQAGYDAVGIDSSSEMIRQARSRHRGTFLNLSFTDIRQLEGRFDCIFSIGNSLSYLPNNLLLRFLDDVNALLNIRGYFVMQVINWDKYRTEGSSDFPTKTLLGEQTFHRRYEDIPGEGNVIFHTEVRKDGVVLDSWSDPLNPKYVQELQSGVQKSGLGEVEFFGDFEGSPYNPLSSGATVMVVRKGNSEG